MGWLPHILLQAKAEPPAGPPGCRTMTDASRNES